MIVLLLVYGDQGRYWRETEALDEAEEHFSAPDHQRSG